MTPMADPISTHMPTLAIRAIRQRPVTGMISPGPESFGVDTACLLRGTCIAAFDSLQPLRA